MEVGDLEKGRTSLLQALAIMRDVEEHGRKYGGIPELICKGRETSITVLCDMIVRLKKELESKNKIPKLLEDILAGWTKLSGDREEMSGKIKELEEENKSLLEKVKQLEEESRTRLSHYRQSSSGDNDHCELEREDYGNGNDTNENDSNRRNCNLTISEQYRISPGAEGGNGDGYPQNSGYFGNGNRPTSRGFSVKENQSQNYSHSLLNQSPFENVNLDRSYYNPTKFFQRLSSSSVRGKGGKRGGGSGSKRKPKEAGTTSSKISKPRGAKAATQGTKKRGKKAAEKVAEAVEAEAAAEAANDSNASSELNLIEDNSESPDKCFFDYSTTYTDETS